MKSIECLKRVLEYNPRSVEANYLYGIWDLILANSLHSLGRLSEADKAYEKTITLSPY